MEDKYGRKNAENLAEEWRRWEKSFKIYYAAAKLHSKTAITQVAISFT